MENGLNIVGWLLSIIAATGNGFVVFLIAKNRRLHSPANWFVLSLAVADVVVAIVVFPPGYFCHYSVACNLRVYVAFFWFFLHSSVTNLCVLAWDRYTAIVQPFKYNNSMTKRRPGTVILIAWFIPLATFLLLFVETYATKSKTVQKILRITSVSVFDLISCAMLFYAIIRILVVARTQSHQLQVQSSCSSTGAATPRRRQKHSSALFITALVLFFLGCYIVVSCLVLCVVFSCSASDKVARIGQVVTCLLVLNSAVNPLVYAFLKRDIKKEIKKLICLN